MLLVRCISINSDYLQLPSWKWVNYELVSRSCNLWRNYGDIQESYDSLMDIVDRFAVKQDTWAQYSGSGQWNDPDMVRILYTAYSKTI